MLTDVGLLFVNKCNSRASDNLNVVSSILNLNQRAEGGLGKRPLRTGNQTDVPISTSGKEVRVSRDAFRGKAVRRGDFWVSVDATVSGQVDADIVYRDNSHAQVIVGDGELMSGQLRIEGAGRTTVADRQIVVGVSLPDDRSRKQAVAVVTQFATGLLHRGR